MRLSSENGSFRGIAVAHMGAEVMRVGKARIFQERHKIDTYGNKPYKHNSNLHVAIDTCLKFRAAFNHLVQAFSTLLETGFGGSRI